ncbi:TetR/AcrR family transcriptional regulator [Parasphingopyxis sp. CP4]|uniref:TetR/AcrR family transcriptional regulator n=1 Tax=Parasphingopyxis sp. CP4 TaxID=2724527 RepID=UPI0015A059EA|nr:TetR/AcrR family transcriptional regulator [Parasphingopyxis sp. CP4]QLC23130.1 TetR/AcrR family transcriptional regulator [Parasphingopyxis sp. CP4]
MPRRPATESQREEVRQKIRSAAKAIYRDKGISGISARAIAVSAGVSVGTIYAYFGDLQTLMQSLWLEPLDHINAELQSIAEAHGDPVERLRALMAAYLAVATDNPELYRNAFMFVRPSQLPTPDPAEMDSVVFVALIKQALLDGQNSGRIQSGSVEQMAQLIWAGLHGSIALPVNFDRIALTADTGSQMIDMLITELTGTS